ncbi:hypothetical protein DH86_00003640, partial [Scytalidium sp. 3C]
MGKRSRKDGDAVVKEVGDRTNTKKSFLVDNKAVDPTLAQLFASSAGPVKPPPLSRYSELPTTNGHGDDQSGSEVEDNDDEDLSSLEGDIEEANLLDLPDDEQDLEKPLALDDIIESKADKKERKRKRKQEDGLEEEYMR